MKASVIKKILFMLFNSLKINKLPPQYFGI
jgi:hypothetical protein